MISIIFFGTPDFVLPIPQAFLETKVGQIVAVVTNPDRPVGRKQILTPSPIKAWAREHQIPALTPENFDTNSQFPISNYHPDLGVLAAYGKIIPQELINLFPLGILVIHPSLLPKYRGASPVQAAIINGDKETGVSIIKMDEKMDHGPIVSQFTEEIRPDDTAETLYARLFQMSAEVLVTLLPAWTKGKITPREQNHSKATFTKLLKKEDGFIPPGIIATKRGLTSKGKLGPYEIVPTPESLERFIRAMTPWPGAWTEIEISNQELGIGKKRIKILKAHIEKTPIPNSKYPISKLVLDQVQLEGKKPVSWQEFQKAYPDVKLIPLR